MALVLVSFVVLVLVLVLFLVFFSFGVCFSFNSGSGFGFVSGFGVCFGSGSGFVLIYFYFLLFVLAHIMINSSFLYLIKQKKIYIWGVKNFLYSYEFFFVIFWVHVHWLYIFNACLLVWSMATKNIYTRSDSACLGFVRWFSWELLVWTRGYLIVFMSILLKVLKYIIKIKGVMRVFSDFWACFFNVRKVYKQKFEFIT